MTFKSFMKASATVFCTVIVATFTACVDQDNSELRTPKSPDDPIIAPAKPVFDVNRQIDENGPEAIVDLSLKVDSGSLSDKGSMKANFKTTVLKDKLQITVDMLNKTHKSLGFNVTNINNVTKGYSENFAINDLDTIQAKASAGTGSALGYEFTIVVDSIKVTKWENKTAEKPTAVVAGAKRVDNVPTEVTYFCHEVGTHRANAADAKFNVVTKVQYTTWIPEDGIELIGDYAKNVRRSVKNFIDTQYWTYVEKYKKGEETWENETNYTNSYTFKVETISLEDLFTTSFDLSQVKPNGISLGIESEEKEGENGTTYVEKTDIYSASRTIGGSAQNTVYRMTNRKIMWKKGSVSLTFGFIAPNVKEISDYMNTNNKSADREGYDMQVFENVVEIAYGVDSTGISKDRFSESGKVYVKKQVTPQEVTIKSIDVTVTISVADNVETVNGKGTITYSDGSTKPVNVTKTSAITYDTDPAWTINGTKKEQTTSDFSYAKSSSTAKTSTIEGEDFTANWKYDAESYRSTEKVTSNGQEKSNGTTMNMANNWILVVEGQEFKAEVLNPTCASSNDHLTEDATNGLTTTYYYGVNHTWKVKDNSKELHPSGTITVTVDDEVIDQHWYDISDQTVLGVTTLGIKQYRKYKSGKEETETRTLEYNNFLKTWKTWSSKETSNAESAQGAQITSSIVDHLTNMEWNYDVTKGTVVEQINLDGSFQTDEWEYSYLSGASITLNGDTYTFPARTVTVSSVAGNSKSYENDDETGYAHTNALTMTVSNSGYSFNMSATANGSIIVAKDKPQEPEEKPYGAYLGTKWCAAPNGSATIYGFSMRFEKGSIPGYVKENGEVVFSTSRFEEGSFIYDGACINDWGELVNCYTTRVNDYGLVWYRGTNTTQTALSFDDLTLIHFNNRHNEFDCSEYGKMESSKSGNDTTFTIPGTNWSWKY